VASAAALSREIFNNYRIYFLVDPVVHFVRAVDSLGGVVSPNLADAEHALKSLIAQEKKLGRDVSQTKKPMRDLESQISAIEAKASGLADELLGFTPAQWNANHALLEPAGQAIVSSRTAAVQALADITTVEGMLK